MNRRQFLQKAGVLSGALATATPELVRAQRTPVPGWRTFEVTTEIDVLKPVGATRIWAPAALLQHTPFQRTVRNTVYCDTGTARTVKGTAGLEFIAAEFPPGAKPALKIISEVKTRNWAVEFAAANGSRSFDRSELNAALQPTTMLPTNGIVKERADQITKGAHTDLDKARAIYDWIVENTYRNPKTRGCGIGDIRFMLESGDLGGKCADLNALYVGLARAAGLPARDVYGLRIAPSEMGCKSLGASSENITKAQHCRAEVFVKEYGWIPVDPADLRKLVLEEPPGHLSLQDALVEQTRKRLFGSWEMNWMAFNYAQDITLPDASGPRLHFLMYPQAESAEGRLDCLDADHFRYAITSRELST